MSYLGRFGKVWEKRVFCSELRLNDCSGLRRPGRIGRRRGAMGDKELLYEDDNVAPYIIVCSSRSVVYMHDYPIETGFQLSSSVRGRLGVDRPGNAYASSTANM